MKTYLTLCFILFALPSWAEVCKFRYNYFDFYEPTRYIYKNYENGKKEGTWIIKQDDIILSRQSYKNDKLEGYSIEYSLSHSLTFFCKPIKVRKLKSHGYYRNNKKDGFWKYYNNGMIYSKGFYKDGKKEGLWNFYYSTGADFYNGHFKNNRKEGVWVNYYLDGTIRSKRSYSEGKKDGEWVWYQEDGKTASKGIYINGIKEGKWRYYKSNGTLKEHIS